ncbi:unnamed protein product, partial [Ectocarpus sp. 8 AP-2014]
AWGLGALSGSGFGGVLAEPASHYPSLFSESGLFARFPYLLPNMLGAGLALLSLPLVFLFLPETLPKGDTEERDLGKAPSPRFLAASSARGEGEPLEFVSSPTHRRRKSGSSVGRRGSKTDSDASLLVLGN